MVHVKMLLTRAAPVFRSDLDHVSDRGSLVITSLFLEQVLEAVAPLKTEKHLLQTVKPTAGPSS